MYPDLKTHVIQKWQYVIWARGKDNKKGRHNVIVTARAFSQDIRSKPIA
jgi:hypothetical protein